MIMILCVSHWISHFLLLLKWIKIVGAAGWRGSIFWQLCALKLCPSEEMRKTHTDRRMATHLHKQTLHAQMQHTSSEWCWCQLGVMVISETGGAANEHCEWEERLQLKPLIALKAFHTIYPVTRDGGGACVCQSAYVGGWVGEEKEIILRKHTVRRGERNAQWFYTYAVPISHAVSHIHQDALFSPSQ